MFKFEQSVLNSEGQPIVGAQVAVYLTGTSTMATLYEDDQTTTKTNPLTTDATGFVSCKAANGKYDYTVSVLVNGSFQQVRRVNGVIFDDPAEGGNSGISLTMPGEFNVTGSPGSSITVSKKTQTANTFYRGPKTGVAAAPTFDTIIVDDLPIASQSQAEGGSNATTIMTPQRSGQLVASRTGATQPLYKSPAFTYTTGENVRAHGLPSTPTRLELYGIATAANNGYVVGQRTRLDTSIVVNAGNAYGVALSADATNVKAHVSVNGIYMFTNTGSAVFTMSAAQWQLELVAGV